MLELTRDQRIGNNAPRKSSKKINTEKLEKKENRKSKKELTKSLRQNKKQLKKDEKQLKKMNKRG